MKTRNSDVLGETTVPPSTLFSADGLPRPEADDQDDGDLLSGTDEKDLDDDDLDTVDVSSAGDLVPSPDIEAR